MLDQPNRKNGGFGPVPPLIVDVEGKFAGLAVPEGQQFRFMSAHPGFDLLDGSRFTRPEQIRSAAQKLARATKR